VLISDSDLHISQLVLTLLCTVMEVNPDCVGDMKEQILPSTLNLVLSSLLQGSAMSACLLFFTRLVQLGLPGLDFPSILKVGHGSGLAVTAALVVPYLQDFRLAAGSVLCVDKATTVVVME